MNADFCGEPVTRRARTMHVCSVCFRKIESGEPYTVQKSYRDGWYTWRTCAHCESAVRTAWNLRLLDDDGYDALTLIDALADWTVTTARLAVGIRRKWVAFCGYRLMPVPDVIARRCCQCPEPVDEPYSYTWCAMHDAERRARVTRQFEQLAASLGGAS